MDPENGFRKKTSTVCGFSVAKRLGKNGIQMNGRRFFAYFVAVSGLFRPRNIVFYVAFTG